MLAAFLTGGKQEISVRQRSRNSHGVGRGHSSIAGKSDAANHVRYWHLADIPSCSAHVRFRGVKRTCTGSPAEDFDFGSDARVIGGNHGIAVRHHRSTLFGRNLVNSFILDVALTLAAASFASLDCLGAIASLASVNASNGLDALDTLASLNALSAFVGVDALDALASLGSLHTFAGLDALHTPAIRDALSARPSLNPLNGLASLDALHTSCAYITELLLKVCISEADIAVMSGVELPALELTATGDIRLC